MFRLPQTGARDENGSRWRASSGAACECVRAKSSLAFVAVPVCPRSFADSRQLTSLPQICRVSFHDATITVTSCGRICCKGRKVNLSHAFAGQNVGVTQVGDHIWLVTFMQCDLGRRGDRRQPAARDFASRSVSALLAGATWRGPSRNHLGCVRIGLALTNLHTVSPIGLLQPLPPADSEGMLCRFPARSTRVRQNRDLERLLRVVSFLCQSRSWRSIARRHTLGSDCRLDPCTGRHGSVVGSPAMRAAVRRARTTQELRAYAPLAVVCRCLNPFVR